MNTSSADMMPTQLKKIYGLVLPLFNNKFWKNTNTINKVAFYNTSDERDEYVISVGTYKCIESNKCSEINVSVPISTIAYKQSFFNMDDVVDYVKMHITHYEKKHIMQ